ncbi:EboA domain-containing protein [Streptomyces sp. enrichment culture]|uniref:EboA domain-containing protein n=1 Tax=Streptomyces sp. enrichment culture TaxID=1795815 RepID=UPI003F564968
MTGGHLADVLKEQVADPAWLHDAERRVAQDPAAVAALFPAAGRKCGRDELTDPGPELAGWTVDDAARVLLLTALPLHGAALAEQVTALYWNGAAAERRAVLRALAHLDIGSAAVDLLHDALRTNDPRLIAAAVGPGARHLDDGMWRQAVLKCVFMDIPLTAVADLDRRADGELARMLADLDDERRAAGRSLPDDATVLLALIGDRAPARSGEDKEKAV